MVISQGQDSNNLLCTYLSKVKVLKRFNQLDIWNGSHNQSGIKIAN